jgi:hypothetical protein
MNVLLLTAHSIAEYDDLRMLTDLGYETFSIGAYSNPQAPGDNKRPALPNAPYFQDLAGATADQMAAKANLPDAVLDWADTVIVHHYPESWIGGQWHRIKGKRVIWRTCGQSNPVLERHMAQFVREGLQVVRYSPKEKDFFESRDGFAGQDAVIRFGKYPSDFPVYRGRNHSGFVTNVTQHMVQRAQFCGLSWYLAATEGLTAAPAGPGSEALPGGVGELETWSMYQHLAKAAAYVYTGTLPASYTLGLIEAIMVGVPVVSIGPNAWSHSAAGLFEGHDFSHAWSDDPAGARRALQHLLDGTIDARRASENQDIFIEEFSIERIGPQWKEFLG